VPLALQDCVAEWLLDDDGASPPISFADAARAVARVRRATAAAAAAAAAVATAATAAAEA
jgi:hypothetical protein